MNLELFILVALLSFFCEYIDSSLGMGYGTTLTPLLIIVGFQPLQIVPAVLLSQLFAGISAGLLHHKVGNVNFSKGSHALKVVIVIAFCSIGGSIAAVFLAISLPKIWLKIYISVLILIIGIVLIATLKRSHSFSWKKITILGIIAAFNKGISGGGYGPVVTGGQLMAGVNAKNAIGITALAEGLTCIASVLTYHFTKSVANWNLAAPLLIGALLSVPLSAYTVKKIATNKMKFLVAAVTMLLGCASLLKTLL
jgi:uncharacterized membrane protein YfcA